MRDEARESLLLHGGQSISAGNPATRRAMRSGPEALRHCLTAVLPLGHTLPACNCCTTGQATVGIFGPYVVTVNGSTTDGAAALRHGQ